jgi:hypothetical protein
MWIGLLPLLFVIFGFLGLRSSLGKLRRRTGGAGGFGVPLAAEVAATTVVPGMDATLDDGPRTLQPRPSPMTKFLGVLGIACFWNGIVSVFVFQIIKGWHSGPFEWFMAAFFSIFIVIGLGLIGAVFYCFLALFNPRPRLVISPGVARLGEAIRIDWEIAGRVQILQNLQLRLQGREEATYPNGKNTSTERSVFADLQIATTGSWQEMQTGDQSITIPATLMHSFAGQHNKILWSVRVRGQIPRRPDLDEEFPITVLPARGQTSLTKL